MSNLRRERDDQTFLVYVPGDDDACRYFGLESVAVAYAEELIAEYPGLNVHVCAVVWTTAEGAES